MTPILCSPIPRRPKLQSDLAAATQPTTKPSGYVLWSHQVAESEHVPFVDLNAIVMRHYADATIAAFGIKAGGANAVAQSLSGGNLQKFIVGREMRQRPKVLIAAQPTWGVDVGAAAQIRQALLDLRVSGVAILVVSEELDELFEICDGLAVIAHGRLSEVKRLSETSVEEIGMLMSGASAKGPGC